MKFLEDGTQEGKLFLSTLKRGRRAHNGTMFQNLDYHGSSDAILASKTPVSQSLELIAATFLLPVPLLVTCAFLVSNSGTQSFISPPNYGV